MQGDEGPNRESRTGTGRSMTRKVAGQQAEMPEQRWRVGGGTAEGKASARQACPARAGDSGDGSTGLMEEVLRRANLMAAHQRVVRNGGAPGGASHMHSALPARLFRRQGLVSFLDEYRRLACSV